MAASSTNIRWRDLLLGPKRAAVWTICLGVALHAFNWFVVSTITPSAVIELQGTEFLSWVTAFFLVFSIVGSSGAAFLKAKLGLRSVLIGASVAAAIGSLIIAMAPNMEVLLAGRVVQGFAEGMVLALCYVIAADVVGEKALPSLFGLLAVVWATATIGGPILGGVLAHVWSWRAAAGALAPVAILFMIMALVVLPARGNDARAKGWPLLRMVLLTGGSLALCVASDAKSQAQAITVMVIALMALALGFVLDRRARSPLFPSRILSPHPASSLGLWIIGLMPLAEAGVFLFIPYVAQIHMGMSVMHAGQISSLTAIGWSFSAMIVARAGARTATRLIMIGPVLLTAGMLLMAWAVEHEQPVMMGAALLACGIAFGICNGFLCQRTIAASDNLERDVTSGAIPTFEGLGAAIGAALAGIIAAGAGFPLADSTSSPIALTLLIGGILTVPAIFAALRFARQTGGTAATAAQAAE
jgi:MFS family permease